MGCDTKGSLATWHQPWAPLLPGVWDGRDRFWQQEGYSGGLGGEFLQVEAEADLLAGLGTPFRTHCGAVPEELTPWKGLTLEQFLKN